MAIIATGVKKRVAYKKETTWGTLAGASGAKQLRRVTSTFNLTKEVYESNEIRTDYQVADMRHGVRSATGSINGELSPKTYSDFIGSVVARDFTTGVSAATLSITIAGTGPDYTITRAAGDWVADGFKAGTVIRLTGAGFDPINVNKNFLITVVTSATELGVIILDPVLAVPEGPIASATATTTGKRTYAPLTGHTDDSYTVEEFYDDINQSEVFTGLKVGTVGFQLPATGFATVDISLTGKDLELTDTVEYFTTPTALGQDGLNASVNGALVVNGIPVALLTSLDFTIERGLTNAIVVGSNSLADVFVGRIRVTGNFSAYFSDGAFRDYFADESEISIVAALTTGTEKNADFIAFALPRVKVGSADKDDTETGLSTSHTFTGLLNDTAALGFELTTIQIQDSNA